MQEERLPKTGLDYATRDYDGFKYLMIQELKREYRSMQILVRMT